MDTAGGFIEATKKALVIVGVFFSIIFWALVFLLVTVIGLFIVLILDVIDGVWGYVSHDYIISDSKSKR